MFNKYQLTFLSAYLRLVVCLLLFSLSSLFLSAQLDLVRLQADWKKAGVVIDSLPSYDNVVNVTSFRLVGDGVTPNDLYFKQLLARYEGEPTIFYFPAGKYLFLSPINLSNYFILKGESSRQTKLIFDLKGKFRNCINAIGNVNTSVYTAQTDVLQWSKEILLNRTDGLKVGDMVLLTSEDSNLVESEWAKSSTGQISTIDSVGTQMIVLREVIRRTHPKTYSPELHIINPVKGVGIECLSVERKDATPFQTTNIYFKYAMNCWVSGVEGNKCNYTHVEFRSSYHLSLINSYFHDAFDYGDGGKGYGVLVHFHSSLCLVENNIFEQLRHSMILQAGANGNVIGYNHSRNVYWENVQGTDRAGDLVLHGNYPYANLLESNVVQNIIVDDSHGMNGIYNLFTRNRAESYGIFVSTTFPPTPEQIFDGNETTNLEDGYGRYGLFGYHLEFGNHIKGTIIPAGTTPLQTASYYKSNAFPKIGLPYPLNEHKILAQENYDNQQFTTCLEIRNTNCAPSLVLSAPRLETGVYQAAQYLSTNGEVVVNANSTVVFEAGESIVLEEGFVTGDEADFSTSLKDCDDTSNTKILEQRTPAITNDCSKSFLNLFPNPADQRAWLEFEAVSEGEGKYLVYNQQGIILQQKTITFQSGKNRQLIDLNQLPNGLYYLTFVLENRTSTEKIIVMRM